MACAVPGGLADSQKIFECTYREFPEKIYVRFVGVIYKKKSVKIRGAIDRVIADNAVETVGLNPETIISQANDGNVHLNFGRIK